MKKLLSLLSVLTISGTAVPTTIAASPYQKEETINRNKRETRNINKLILDCTYIGYSGIKILISHDTWQTINFWHSNKTEQEFKNSLKLMLKNFDKVDDSCGPGLIAGKIDDKDIDRIVNFINDHYSEIDKKQNYMGIRIGTNRNNFWGGIEYNDYYGVFKQ